VDLGAGCGVVGLALAQATPGWGATLVELQPRLAALCRLNVAEADLADRVEVCEADLRHRSERLRGAAFSLAVSNPPFRPADAGRQSPDPERARAHSEQTLTLPSLVDAAARLLRPGGAFCVVYPAERLPALLSACATADLRPTRLRLVHPRPDQPARRVLLAARKGGGRALEVASPLFVHTEAGEYSPEAAVILDGAWLDGT
jgi:tRNA1Val (adenine37-N6)-methyltransferase